MAKLPFDPERTLTYMQQLSEALRTYDLRDYMLLKSRIPGPRSKHKDLPEIDYGTVRVGRGYGLGMCVSYRFFKEDVEMISDLVHGDIDDHMEAKRKKTAARQDKQFRKLHIELKTRLSYGGACEP